MRDLVHKHDITQTKCVNVTLYGLIFQQLHLMCNLILVEQISLSLFLITKFSAVILEI